MRAARVRLDGSSVDLDGPIAPVAAEDEEPSRIRGLRLEKKTLRTSFADAQLPRPRVPGAPRSGLDDDLLGGQSGQRAESVDRARGLAPARGEADVGQGARVLIQERNASPPKRRKPAIGCWSRKRIANRMDSVEKNGPESVCDAATTARRRRLSTRERSPASRSTFNTVPRFQIVCVK